MSFSRTYFCYLPLCVLLLWCGCGDKHALAQSEPVAPLIHNMTKRWEWGGSISTMKPVSDTLYVGMGRDFVLFDITDPTTPQELGSVDLDAYVVDIELVGNYALLAGDSDGLFIVDIRDKRHPVLVLERHDPFQVKSIAIDGRYAYVAFNIGGGSGGGIQILDITQPASPIVVNEQVAGVEFVPNDLQIAGGYLFAAGRATIIGHWIYDNYGVFQAFDLADLTDPSPLPAYYTEKKDNAEIEFRSLVVRGNNAYLLQYYTITRFAIDNPAELVPGAQLTLSNIGVRPLQVSGEYLYAAAKGGVYILDPTLPTAIRVKDFIALPASMQALQDGYVYAVSAEDGLHVFDISNPSTPLEVGAYRMPAPLYADLAVRQQTLYVTGGSLGRPLLSVIDLHSPTQPILTAMIAEPERLGIYPFVDNEWLIMPVLAPDFKGNDQYYIFDITDPNLPQRMARHSIIPFASAIYANHQLYLKTLTRTPPSTQIRSFDLSDPSHPITKTVIPVVFNSVASLHPFSVDAEYLYYVGDTEPNAEPRQWTPRLYIYALSTGETIATLDLPQRMGELYHHNDTLYAVANWQYGSCPYTIYMIDIADPTAPALRQNFCWRRAIDKFIFAGHLLYLADRDSAYSRNSQTGLSVIDFTVPHAPRLAGYAYEPGAEPQIAMISDTIYLAGDRLGAYRYTPPQAVAQLSAGGVLTVPVDAITYTFPSTAFAEPVVVTHTTRYVDPWLAFSAPWVGIGNAFALTSTAPTTGAFTLTIGYPAAAAQLGEVATLALYRWADGAWVAEPSVVDPATQTVTATPTTTGVWMLCALARNRLYLPVIHHAQP